jgi:hypothetical protein
MLDREKASLLERIQGLETTHTALITIIEKAQQVIAAQVVLQYQLHDFLHPSVLTFIAGEIHKMRERIESARVPSEGSSSEDEKGTPV